MAITESVERSLSNSSQRVNRESHAENTAAQSLNSRSCIECCRRKVRCDRLHPCKNCIRHQKGCIFPTSRKSTRRARRLTDISTTSVSSDQDARGPTISATLTKDLSDRETPIQNAQRYHTESVDDSSTAVQPVDLNHDIDGTAQLTVVNGHSRYIGNQFWVGMSHDVSEHGHTLLKTRLIVGGW